MQYYSHKKYSLVFPQRGTKKTIVMMALAKSIIQALAPCLSVGCRAVNELVSRALFMDSYEIMKIVYHFMLNLANLPII
jgi:hypothetical protein